MPLACSMTARLSANLATSAATTSWTACTAGITSTQKPSAPTTTPRWSQSWVPTFPAVVAGLAATAFSRDSRRSDAARLIIGGVSPRPAGLWELPVHVAVVDGFQAHHQATLVKRHQRLVDPFADEGFLPVTVDALSYVTSSQRAPFSLQGRDHRGLGCLPIRPSRVDRIGYWR